MFIFLEKIRLKSEDASIGVISLPVRVWNSFQMSGSKKPKGINMNAFKNQVPKEVFEKGSRLISSRRMTAPNFPISHIVPIPVVSSTIYR